MDAQQAESPICEPNPITTFPLFPRFHFGFFLGYFPVTGISPGHASAHVPLCACILAREPLGARAPGYAQVHGRAAAVPICVSVQISFAAAECGVCAAAPGLDPPPPPRLQGNRSSLYDGHDPADVGKPHESDYAVSPPHSFLMMSPAPPPLSWMLSRRPARPAGGSKTAG